MQPLLVHHSPCGDSRPADQILTFPLLYTIKRFGELCNRAPSDQAWGAGSPPAGAGQPGAQGRQLGGRCPTPSPSSARLDSLRRIGSSEGYFRGRDIEEGLKHGAASDEEKDSLEG